MPRKESMAVPGGNGPIPQQEEYGSGQPTLEDVYRMAKEVFEVGTGKWIRFFGNITRIGEIWISV